MSTVMKRLSKNSDAMSKKTLVLFCTVYLEVKFDECQKLSVLNDIF